MKKILLCLSFVAYAHSLDAAELVVSGGRIYTMNPSQPQVEAVAVEDGRIVYAGDVAGLAPHRGPRTRSIDLGAGVMYPGFVDAHAHISNLGKALAEVDLVGTQSANEVRDRVIEAAKGLGPDEWVLGRGWDQNDWEVKEFPTAAMLMDVPNPVFLERVDGHAVWVNQRTLDLAGIDANTAVPSGGDILRDTAGNPTGVLIDNAEELVKAIMPKPSRQERERRLRLALAECHRYGLVGVHEAGIDGDTFAILRELSAAGELDFRVYAMVDVYQDSVFSVTRMQEGAYDDGYLTVRGGQDLYGWCAGLARRCAPGALFGRP